MSIFRDCCRASERVSMKSMQSRGWSVQAISNKLRIKTHIVEEVLSGSWDELEKAITLAAMKANEEKIQGKRDEEANRIAQIAAAAAAAITGQVGRATPTMDVDDLRAQIEAQVRAEIAAETELSRGQKAAATRAANKAKEEAA